MRRAGKQRPATHGGSRLHKPFHNPKGTAAESHPGRPENTVKYKGLGGTPTGQVFTNGQKLKEAENPGTPTGK